jgi:response regulator RpfG family c-di-GMP phosphodiesterase
VGPSAAQVLYVDDDVGLCRLFLRVFSDDVDLAISTAGSGPEAVDLIRSRSFDVIISDLRMPGMNGLDFLAAARRERPEARRLLVSGQADFGDALEAINRVGIDRLLTKPWELNDLRNAVRAAAEHAALIRENIQVTAELRHRTDDLLRVNESLDALVEERTGNLLDGLVSALDLRDSETQWHSRRVGRYARRLAHELGIAGRELDDIERGATLHDIGKIGVRDAVLLKPGPLDEREWAEMRRHPALGYEILKGIGFLERARLVPLHHQERFDGSGYPQGLKGSAICVGARVFAVVDTYDAITNDRPYRKCQTYEVARAEIVKCTGTQFDPEVVHAWLRISPAEWIAIREEIEKTA